MIHVLGDASRTAELARGLFVPMDFLDDEVSDAESNASLHQFTINEHYAKAFAYKKEREELSKCAISSCATHSPIC